MSSIVVKKSRWEETSVEDIFMDSCWGHAARIFRMIPKGLHIKYLRESFLKKRSGNDSFMDKGLVHRLAIAIDGYQKIGDIIFGNTSMEAHCIRKVLRKEIPLKFLLKAKALSTTSGECKKLIALTKKHFQDTPFLFFVGPLAISLFLHCLGKPVLMIYEKKRQAKTVLRKILKRLLG